MSGFDVGYPVSGVLGLGVPCADMADMAWPDLEKSQNREAA